jgi:minor extracellular serine protease Vpr
MKQLYVSIGVLLFAGIAAGQVVPDRYILELAGEPAARAVAGKSAARAAMADRRAAVIAQQQRVRAAVAAADVEVLGSVDTVANALFVRAGAEQIERLRQTPGVLRVYRIRMYRPAMDRAVYLTRVADAWAQLGGTQMAGAGIKIGIIDTGIDNSHPAFQDADFTAPDGFPRVNKDSDLRYTNGKVIVARSYDSAASSSARDVKGHGTSVAMITAGGPNAGPYGVITGVAPRAWLASYKVFPDSREGAPTNLIMQALDDAVKDGMDVVNLSLGSAEAERPQDDPLVSAVERAVAAGVIVVVAAGNEGPDLNTIGSPGTAISAVTVGNSGNDRVFSGRAIADGLAPMLALPGESGTGRQIVSGVLTDVAALDENGLACGTLPEGSLRGRIALILRGTCVFEEKLNNAQEAGAIAAIIYTDAARPEPVSMGTGTAQLPASMISYADGVRLLLRMQDSADLRVMLQFTNSAFPVDPARLSDSSSAGPSSGFAIKPDLVAVGTSIYTARPGGYAVATGTSLSSPLVAGAAGLLKAARPGLTVEQYRSLLINSSSTFSVNGGASPLNVQQGGAGLLNMTAALGATVAAYPSSISFGVSGGTIDATETVKLASLSGEVDALTIDVQPIGSGARPQVSRGYVELAPGTPADVSVSFSGANLPGGAYQGFIVVRSTRNGNELRVPYWYGVPSGVARKITLLSEADPEAEASSDQYIVFRITDAAGLAVRMEPSVAPTTGTGRVRALQSIDNMVPDAWVAIVRVGAGDNTFRITAGELTRDVTIVGN